MGERAGMAVPRFGRAGGRRGARSAAYGIAMDRTLARDSARRSSQTRGVAFDPSTEAYTLPQVRDLDHPSGTNYTVALSQPPLNVDLVAAWFGGDALLSFDMFGIPDSDGIVVIRSGQEYRAVFLDENGTPEIRTLTKFEATPLVVSPPVKAELVGTKL